MLSEIAQVCLMLGTSGMEPPIVVSPGERKSFAESPLERAHLLRDLWRQIEPLVSAAVRCPDTRLQSAARSLPLAQAQGGHQTMTAIARSPQSAGGWAAAFRSKANVLSAKTAAAVNENRNVSTFDTVPNRFLAALLNDLHGEAETLAALAVFCDAEAEAETMCRIAEAAGAWRNTSLLHGLLPLASSEQARLRHGAGARVWNTPYRALMQHWRHWHGSLRLDWAGSFALRLPVPEAWEMYEIWCCLRTAAILVSDGWELREGDALCLSPQGLRLVLARGQRSRLCFTRPGSPDITLWYQPLFPSVNQTASAYASRSHAMHPDIALEIRGRLYLLDPKFRTYAPEETPHFTHADSRASSALLDDINKMHTYRDAIVRNEVLVVREAWCLFAGNIDPAPDRFVYPMPAPDAPFGTAGIGAIRLRPGGTDAALRALLRGWIDRNAPEI